MLGLRKGDKPHSVNRTEPTSQLNSRKNNSNIKDILVRNFFRKFPISMDVNDMEQIRIEKEAAKEFEIFVQTTREINSKNLNAHENHVAEKLGLKRVHT